MSVASDFYRDRADECAREAADSPLQNVRERFERSALAWRSMADRLTRGEALRDANSAGKEAKLGIED